jgi:hypothetical protein
MTASQTGSRSRSKTVRAAPIDHEPAGTARAAPDVALLRKWIAEGLAHEDDGEVDPVLELHPHLDAATQALKAGG